MGLRRVKGLSSAAACGGVLPTPGRLRPSGCRGGAVLGLRAPGLTARLPSWLRR